MNLKILFFTTATEHTTFRKTAKMLAKEGAEVKIIGFTRNNFPEGSDSVPTEILGTISHGNYFVRSINLFKSIAELRKQSSDFDVVYCFALDTLIIAKTALILKRKPIVYQVQDIKKQLIGNTISARIYRLVERLMMKNIAQLVVSSEDYYTNYFAKYHNFSEGLTTVIENKLIEEPITTIATNNSNLNDKIKIGYFGVMRCKRSWEILKNTIQKGGNHYSLYLRGKPNAIPNILEEIEKDKDKQIYFGGPYSSPDDLNSLYERVDIVWAAYPYNYGKEGNWQMARTIRFYEACAFGRPVLVQKGTPHAKDVSSFEIGKVIDMSDINTAVEEVLSITPADINKWKENLLKLDRSMFVHTDEYENLYKILFDTRKK